ncbi:MAG: D-2-hydroxyacid dehydrogenase [Acidobacteria bacterium]|nr:MAG: D-2-hydroxyacid dehydrogenase [Acidobacteriota bacterium]
MKVLVAIHHRVDAWTIPAAHVEQLRTRFPHVTFLHSTTRESDIALAADADVAFAIVLSREAAARARRLQWLHCSAHAVGHFPLADLAARGIIVTNSRGIQAVPIAEHVMACLLALARKLPETLRDQQKRVWRPNTYVGDASPRLLAGRTIGVVGVVTLGEAIATRAKAFGMHVIGMRRNPQRGAPTGFDEIVGPADRNRLLTAADVVVLAAPLTAETQRLLDAATIASMKRGAIVVNVARGQLIDEAALAEALEAGRLGGAVLDVFTIEPLAQDSPFWSMLNVVVTPHNSGFRTGHFDAVVDLFSENLRRFERGVDLLNRVDLQTGY